ncbi:MAG: TonB family protein [Sandarakinorhabdus sp.]|nr:TonB family protein [Sandarakinorhabdus sp.]
MSNDRFTTARRDGSALAITIGLHVGVAAVALLAVTVSMPRRPPTPIVTKAYDDPVKPEPVDTPPPMIESPITLAIEAPIITIDNPPPRNWDDTVPGEPPILGPGPTPAADDPPVLSHGATTPARFDPRFAASMQPPYPATSRRLAEQGAVVVHIRIGRDGRVTAASLAQSSGSPRLDAAALAHALKYWRFTPALADGKTVEATRDITVNFRLADA